MEKEFLDYKFVSTDELPKSLSGMVFENCLFKGCDLKEINFAHGRIIECNFDSCDLSNINLRNARLRDSHFKNCKMLGLKWGDLDDLSNLSFQGCNLGYSNFSGLKLKKNKFIECLFEEVDFAQADFSECDFSSSDFLNARFDETNLTKTNFSRATRYLIDPNRNKIKGAKFSLPDAIGLLQGLGVVIVDN